MLALTEIIGNVCYSQILDFDILWYLEKDDIKDKEFLGKKLEPCNSDEEFVRQFER